MIHVFDYVCDPMIDVRKLFREIPLCAPINSYNFFTLDFDCPSMALIAVIWQQTHKVVIKEVKCHM